MEKDEIWIASRGGVCPRPWGFYAIGLTYGLFWIGFRTAIGLPSTLAPIFESPFVRTPVAILLILLILGFTGLIAGYMLLMYEFRGPYWMPYYGKGRTKRRHFMVAAVIAVVGVEAFFGIFYLLEWLVARFF